MKTCITCLFELDFDKFGKNKRYKDGYRGECKECRNAKLRTGKPNLGRYQKGHKPTHGFQKGQKTPSPFKKGHKPWNKGHYTSEKRGSGVNRWAREVKERDEYKCTRCDSTENLHAHHVIPWKKDKTLKHDINNGITLCRTCHLIIEPRRKKGFVPSEESRKKASITSKGQRRSPITEFKKGHKAIRPFKKGMIPWNKGTKGIMKAWNKDKKGLQVAWNKGLKRNK